MNIRIVPEVFPPIEVQYEEAVRIVFPRHRTVDRASRKVVVPTRSPEHVEQEEAGFSSSKSFIADRLVYIISAMEVAQRRLDLKVVQRLILMLLHVVLRTSMRHMAV